MADEAAANPARAALDFLQTQGVDRSQPVRYAYLAALERRAGEQAEAVRAPLFAKIVAEAERLRDHAGESAASASDAADVPGSPLADLLAYIAAHAATQPPGNLPAGTTNAATPAKREKLGAAPELKSVDYFRSTWSRLSTEQQLTQTLAQAPENAGPMNSQHLVLRSLQTMREVSPDYLQGFMTYVDTLIWLEHAAPGGQKPTPARDGEVKAKTGSRRGSKR